MSSVIYKEGPFRNWTALSFPAAASGPAQRAFAILDNAAISTANIWLVDENGDSGGAPIGTVTISEQFVANFVTESNEMFASDGTVFAGVISSSGDIGIYDWNDNLIFSQDPTAAGGTFRCGPILANDRVYWITETTSISGPTDVDFHSRLTDGTGSVSTTTILSDSAGFAFRAWSLAVNVEGDEFAIAYQDTASPNFFKLAKMDVDGTFITTIDSPNSDWISWLNFETDGTLYARSVGSSKNVFAYDDDLNTKPSLDFTVLGQAPNYFIPNGDTMLISNPTWQVINRSGTTLDSMSSTFSGGAFFDRGHPLIGTLIDQGHNITNDPYTRQAEIVLGLMSVVWTLDAAPTGAVIDSSSGLITWAATTIGVHTFTVRATASGDFDNESFDLTVV